MEDGALVVEVEHEIRGARIAVARLPDRAGIEQPLTRSEVEHGALACEPAVERAVVERHLQRDVAVPDEREWKVAEHDRGDRRLVGEDVLPDGVARAPVIEADAVALALGLERVEIRARGG